MAAVVALEQEIQMQLLDPDYLEEMEKVVMEEEVVVVEVDVQDLILLLRGQALEAQGELIMVVVMLVVVVVVV